MSASETPTVAHTAARVIEGTGLAPGGSDTATATAAAATGAFATLPGAAPGAAGRCHEVLPVERWVHVPVDLGFPARGQRPLLIAGITPRCPPRRHVTCTAVAAVATHASGMCPGPSAVCGSAPQRPPAPGPRTWQSSRTQQQAGMRHDGTAIAGPPAAGQDRQQQAAGGGTGASAAVICL
jgi:hypothetical protein